MQDKATNDARINQAFLELKKEFPFGEAYIERKRARYLSIASRIVEMCPKGAKVLSIGAGPCGLEAMLSKLQFKITVIDDLNDHWHLIGNNRQKIVDFAEEMGIELFVQSYAISEMKDFFDAVLLINVIEHLDNSPRMLLNFSLSSVKTNGLLIVQTPNSVALIKRLRLVVGKYPYVNADLFYWNIGNFRGHFREYSASELKDILLNHNLSWLKIETTNQMINMMRGGLSFSIMKLTYQLLSLLSPNFKDTILVLARKPINWQPTEASIEQFEKYSPHLETTESC